MILWSECWIVHKNFRTPTRSTKKPNTTFYEAKLTTSSWNFVVILIIFFTQSYNKQKKIIKCIFLRVLHITSFFLVIIKKQTWEKVRTSSVLKPIGFLDSLFKKPSKYMLKDHLQCQDEIVFFERRLRLVKNMVCANFVMAMQYIFISTSVLQETLL